MKLTTYVSYYFVYDLCIAVQYVALLTAKSRAVLCMKGVQRIVVVQTAKLINLHHTLTHVTTRDVLV